MAKFARPPHLHAEGAEAGPDLDQHVGVHAEARTELQDALDPWAEDAVASHRLARREDVLSPVPIVLRALVVLAQVLRTRSGTRVDRVAVGTADIGEPELLERRASSGALACGTGDD